MTEINNYVETGPWTIKGFNVRLRKQVVQMSDQANMSVANCVADLLMRGIKQADQKRARRAEALSELATMDADLLP